MMRRSGRKNIIMAQKNDVKGVAKRITKNTKKLDTNEKYTELFRMIFISTHLII